MQLRLIISLGLAALAAGAFADFKAVVPCNHAIIVELGSDATSAKAIGSELSKSYRFDAANVDILSGAAATRHAILDLFESLKNKKLAPIDEVFVLVAGPSLRAHGKSYFVPNGLSINPTSAMDESALDQSCIDMATVWSQLAKSRSLHLLVAADMESGELPVAPSGDNGEQSRELICRGEAGGGKLSTEFAKALLTGLLNLSSSTECFNCRQIFEEARAVFEGSSSGNQTLVFASSAGGQSFRLCPLKAEMLSYPSYIAIDSVKLREVPVRHALRELFKAVSVKFTVAPEVQGKITLDLSYVGFEKALRNILDQVKATYRVDRGVYEIIPLGKTGAIRAKRLPPDNA